MWQANHWVETNVCILDMHALSWIAHWASAASPLNMTTKHIGMTSLNTQLKERSTCAARSCLMQPKHCRCSVTCLKS